MYKKAVVLLGVLLATGLSAWILMRSGESSEPLPPPAPEAIPATQTPAEHPMQVPLRMAQRSLERLNQVRDYTCTFVKQERIGKSLIGPESMRLKVRHRPFSAYLYCLGPTNDVGQEVIYVAGSNGGKVLAHATGLQHKILGTLSLDPTSSLLMKGSRNPITRIGIKNLSTDLVAGHQKDLQFAECEVSVKDDDVNGVPATRVEIVHPVRRQEFGYHRMLVWYHRDWEVLIRFARYDWPEETGGEPPLIEQYSYDDLKLDVGLTDLDFDPSNSEYGYD